MNNHPKLTLSARTHAMRLSALGKPFSAAELMHASGCSSPTAQTMLGKLAAEGVLCRVAHGVYAAPGVIPVHKARPGGFVAYARGETEDRARYLAEVDAWLADKSPWPGCASPLPVNRAPSFAPSRRSAP